MPQGRPDRRLYFVKKMGFTAVKKKDTFLE
jgi:hypothetical protein